MVCASFLTTGCFGWLNKVEVEEKPLFCDVEEPRRFTQAELDWRAENAPWNLRKDFKTNKAWDRECIPDMGD
jgi:hypothetical protein